MKTANETEALIIMDVQKDFCAGGALSVSEDDSFIAKINILVKNYDCVILTQDWHPADHISFADNHKGAKLYDKITTSSGTQILWPRHCVAGTEGAKFHADLNTDRARFILRKGCHSCCDSYSGFFDATGKPTGLGGFLRELKLEKLTFCGLATDFCVSYTALDAVKLGFESHIALAACRAVDIDGSYNRALKAMQAAGVELGLFT